MQSKLHCKLCYLQMLPYRDAITYTIVIIILFMFANGMFGKRDQEKV